MKHIKKSITLSIYISISGSGSGSSSMSIHVYIHIQTHIHTHTLADTLHAASRGMVAARIADIRLAFNFPKRLNP